MTNACTISCKTASGKSLEELSKLIALRTERMKELTKDAVIATAIDVLVSLRADTRDARSGDRVNPPRRLTPRRDLFVSFRGGKAHIPCLRTGSRHGPEFHHAGSFYIADKGCKLFDLLVFQVVPYHERIKPYFVAAHSASEVLKFEGAMIRRRVDRKGGLARSALGVAMAKLSTRNSADDVSARIRALSSNLSQVSVTGGGGFGASGDFGLCYQSELDYGIPALKSGDGGVDLAMQKAANKIAGMLTHAAHKAGDFEHDVETPFPEVRKAR